MALGPRDFSCGDDTYLSRFREMLTGSWWDSDYTGTLTKLPKILLNGNNICMLIPGGEGPAAS